MAVAWSNIKGWSVDHPYYTADFTLSGGDTGFALSAGVSADVVMVRDTAALAAGVPLYTKSGEYVTVTGCTANGSGSVIVFGTPL